MLVQILSLFPEMVHPALQASILKRARESGILQVDVINFRDFSKTKHKNVDDSPYGGGRGMILKPEPLFEAVEWLKEEHPARHPGVPWSPLIILMSPQGELLTQKVVQDLSRREHLLIICGHYEGVDERVREYLIQREISIGDFILTGGEIPVLVVVDAVTRLLPGVLDEEVVQEESFSRDILDYPQYTRPPEYRGMKVPEILLSGNHEAIAKWRRKEALKATLQRRPDLLEKANLGREEKKFVEERSNSYGSREAGRDGADEEEAP